MDYKGNSSGSIMGFTREDTGSLEYSSYTVNRDPLDRGYVYGSVDYTGYLHPG